MKIIPLGSANVGHVALAFAITIGLGACANTLDSANHAAGQIGEFAGGVVALPTSAAEGVLEGTDRCEENADPYVRNRDNGKRPKCTYEH